MNVVISNDFNTFPLSKSSSYSSSESFLLWLIWSLSFSISIWDLLPSQPETESKENTLRSGKYIIWMRHESSMAKYLFFSYNLTFSEILIIHTPLVLVENGFKSEQVSLRLFVCRTVFLWEHILTRSTIAVWRDLLQFLGNLGSL